MSKWPLNDPGVYVMYGHSDGDIEAVVTTDGRLLVEQDGKPGEYQKFADLTDVYTSLNSSWRFRQTPSDATSWMIPDKAPKADPPPTITTILEDAALAWTYNEIGKAEETMTTSPTGGRKAIKPARFDLIPARALWEVAEHFGKGAEKYGDSNWGEGVAWSKFFQAMQRHAWQFWSGEDYDPQMNSKHLAAVVFHALVLMESMEIHPEFDDRFTHE